MKIVHIITGLNDGGAEAVLYRLCTHDSISKHHVISLMNEGKYGTLLKAKNVKVSCLGIKRGQKSLLVFFKLIRILRKIKPDIVQTWMYHADFVGGISAYLAGIKHIIWGIRHTTLERGKSKTSTIFLVKILAKLSWVIPSAIVICAKSAFELHARLGYNRDKMCFIPNGYDLENFCYRKESAIKFRSILEMPSEIPLVGTVGRYDPQKDHANLLEALAILKFRNVKLRCVLVGANLDAKNSKLQGLIEDLTLKNSLILLGPRHDIPIVMSALDVHVLPSRYGEGFPNVVSEAMACETPCVVTDVGDAAYIVGDTGWVVPPANALALADAIECALNEMNKPEWENRCIRARKRIDENFNIQKMVSSYVNLWQETVRNP